MALLDKMFVTLLRREQGDVQLESLWLSGRDRCAIH